MKYNTILGCDKQISRMIFGCDWIGIKTLELKEKTYKALDDVVSIGCNAFDTAHIYCGGDSERALGMWMRDRDNRDNMVILTKCSHHNSDRKMVTPYDIESELHDSFARLKTDYIDILVLHRDDPSVDVGPIVEILNKYYSLGKIKAFGGSNWTTRRIEEANEYAHKHNLQPFTVSSPNFGLAEQVENPWGEGCVGINGVDHKDSRKWYLENKNVKIFAYSSLARGFFSGKVKSDMTVEQGRAILDNAGFTGYFHPTNLKRLARVEQMAKEKNMSVPQIAVAYAIIHPLNIFSIQSPRNLEEMKQNNVAMDLELTDNEILWLNLEI